MNTNVIIDLENYSTVVDSKRGADVAKHIITNNVDSSLRDLLSHLKSKSKYKIMYEKLSPVILSQVNDLSDQNVKDFHQNAFIRFRDFST